MCDMQKRNRHLTFSIDRIAIIRTTLFVCGVIASLWLAGCMPGTGQPSIPAEVNPSQTPSGSITVWSWNIAAKSLMRLIPGFNKLYPNVKVNVDMTGAQMQTRLMLSLACGVGAPQVSQLQLTDAPHYIDTGRLADLTPVAAQFKDRFPDYLWENCEKNGHVYAIPWDTGPCAVFYKRDIFKRYGIDPNKIDTWKDYIQAGEEILRKSGGKTKMLPLGLDSLQTMYLIILQQTNGQVFDDQGRIAINSNASREALAIIKEMREAGICSDVQMFSQEFMAGINDNSIATYPTAVWFAGTIRDTTKDYGLGKSRWGVFRLPAVTKGGLHVANLGGSVLVIPAQCKNKAAAWAFIKYALCTSKGQADQYRNFDLFPAYLPAQMMPEVTEQDKFFGGERVGKLFAKDISKISKLNITPDWAEASTYIEEALSDWAANGMHNRNFFGNLEVRMQRRLGDPISPQSLRYSENNG